MNTPSSLEVIIEVERGSFAKRRPDGSVEFISPFPCPFAYGSVVGSVAADGDPEDALVLSESPRRGSLVRLPVWGQVCFWDGGLADHKWVLSSDMPTQKQWYLIERFFTLYAFSKRIWYSFRQVPGGVVFEGVRRYP